MANKIKDNAVLSILTNLEHYLIHKDIEVKNFEYTTGSSDDKGRLLVEFKVNKN